MIPLILTLLNTNTTNDPNLIGGTVSQVDDQISINLINPSILSRTPDQNISWSAPTEDVFGDSDVYLGDFVGLRLWVENGLPVGTSCFATLSVGPLTATSQAAGIGLEYSSTGIKTARATNNGSGWVVQLGTGTWNGGIGGAQGFIAPQTSSAESSIMVVHALDSRGKPLFITNTSPTNGSVGSGTVWDTFSVGCGWTSANVGVSNSNILISASLTAIPMSTFPELEKPLDIDPANPPRVVFGIGQSNMGDLGTSSPQDPIWGFQPVQSGATFIKNGVVKTSYDRRPGPIPYLIDALQNVYGVPNPVVVIRAIGGQEIYPYMIDQRFPQLVFDANTLNLKPDVVLYIQGEDDCKTQANAELYEDRLNLLMERAVSEWGAPVMMAECGPTCIYGQYEADVRAAQISVASSVPNVYLVDTDGLPVDSTLHHYTSGWGAGYDQLVDRLLTSIP